MRCWWLIVLTACAEGGSPNNGDAAIDAPDCPMQTFYRDVDGDGHGDATKTVSACEQPSDAVASKDDCDDTNEQRFPGNAELCDGIDNDCATATAETCPANCQPFRRAAPDNKKVYLMCGGATSWANAHTICVGAQYKLAQIESAAENEFIRSTGATLYGSVDLHIGGSDSTTEGMWIWDGSDPFWMGGAGGTAIMNRYANWVSGEPNNNSNEDCAEMKPNGQWNDGGCGDNQRFVCRR